MDIQLKGSIDNKYSIQNMKQKGWITQSKEQVSEEK